MAAVVDDPAGPTLYRVSGQPPFSDPNNPALPPDIVPRQVTLRDRQTVATIVPLAARQQIAHSLCVYLCDQINKEIEGGDTYPMMETFDAEGFARYWFQSIGAVMLLGSAADADALTEDRDWAKECLGSFCIKPNYPGRSSHVCNASFLVTDASRNRGVGRLMGEAYIDWAPRLGYTYSVFNLVYETNVASCKIWDALGFKRIGRIKGCGNLRSHPDRLIDAIIYGRDLTPGESEELVSEERFDKIKFYLKYGKYPNGADRAEKSRLRSAATHYKLLDGDKLMLKDKEVISDPARQYEIARNVHVIHHGGINKTTATIAEKYHWSRIKETVSDVIRTCSECKELGKTPNPGGMRKVTSTVLAGTPSTTVTVAMPDAPGTTVEQPAHHMGAAGRVLALQSHSDIMSTLSQSTSTSDAGVYANPSDISVIEPSHTLQSSQADHTLHEPHHPHHPHPHHHHAHHQEHHHHHHHHEQQSHSHRHSSHHNPMLQDEPNDHESPVYQPIDPQIINHHEHSPHDNPFDHYHPHADFQALLNATEDVVPGQQESDAVDRDLEMLIDHHDDEDDGDDVMDGLVDGVGRDRRAEGTQRGLYDVSFGPGS